jgi:hypothetical protein
VNDFCLFGKNVPKVEADVWTFALNLKAAALVEVFELTQPTRIILDVKRSGGTAAVQSAGSPKH